MNDPVKWLWGVSDGCLILDPQNGGQGYPRKDNKHISIFSGNHLVVWACFWGLNPSFLHRINGKSPLNQPLILKILQKVNGKYPLNPASYSKAPVVNRRTAGRARAWVCPRLHPSPARPQPRPDVHRCSWGCGAACGLHRPGQLWRQWSQVRFSPRRCHISG